MRITSLLLTLAFIFALTACEEQGPAEKAGEQIDEATENIKDAAKDAAEEIGDKTEELGDKIENQTD